MKSMFNKLPSVEHLRSILEYDKNTGLLTWMKNENRSPQWNGKNAGKTAGSIERQGYVVIQMKEGSYKAHRLIWAIYYGEHPGEFEIDHINQNKADNRIENLRIATRRQNIANKPPKRKMPKGVYVTPAGNYKAMIWELDRRNYLGTYKTISEAQAAYDRRAKELFGSYACVGSAKE